MKTTLLQNEDTVQIVLTPETKFEKEALKAIPDDGQYYVKRGSYFADCQGGWVREYSSDDHSLMFVSKKVTPKGGEG